MKYVNLTIAILILSILGCSKDEITEPIPTSPLVNYDIGSYELLEESLANIPYLNKTKALFVDSLGTTIELIIDERDLFNGGPSKLYKFNVFEEGDTVTYSYSTQYKIVNLINEDKNLEFRCTLKAAPYSTDPLSLRVADVYDIFIADPDSTSYSYSVFFDILDKRTWLTAYSNIENDSLQFFGRTFYNVEYNNYQNPKSKVFFNYEYGIVSFTDHNNVKWVFDSFE